MVCAVTTPPLGLEIKIKVLLECSMLVLGLRVPWPPLFALLSCGPKPPSGGVCPVGTRKPGCLQSCVCTIPWTSRIPSSGILFSPSVFLQPSHLPPLPWPCNMLRLPCWRWRSLFPGLLSLLVFLRLFRSYGLLLPASQFCLLLEYIWAEGETKNRKINNNK